MNKILFILLTAFLFACTNNNELDSIRKNNSNLNKFVDSLKTTSLTYKKCNTCNLNGLDGKKLNGFTDRYAPNGYYDKRETKLGEFEYDTYLILDSENDKRTNGHIYFCHFNQNQKESFLNFLPYYINRLRHHKLLYKVIEFNNTVIIITEIQG